jgi:NitT/TauT family transport system permease protein
MSLPRGDRFTDVAGGAAAIVVMLAAWEGVARAGVISPVFFPPPSRVLTALVTLSVDGRLWPHLGATLGRVTAGFVCGGGTGLLAGLAMGRSRRLRMVIEPLVAATHPVPKIALLPLAMLIFGLGEASKVALVAVASFFPMAISTEAGIRLLNPVHLEVARNYGATGLRLYRRVILPGSLPMILTGVRLTLNVALLLAVAVELVAGRVGLGRLVWFSWQTLRTEELYATLVVAALLGSAFHQFVRALERRFVPWVPSFSSQSVVMTTPSPD